VEVFGRTPPFLGTLGHAYAVSGRRTEALRVVNELLQSEVEKLGPHISIATIYTGLGDKDKAFEQLSIAYRQHSSLLRAINANPVFDPLRSDPRLGNLTRRLGLPLVK